MVSDATASSRATSWNDRGGPRPARRAAPHVRAAARRATARRALGGRRRRGAGRLGRRARRRDRRDGELLALLVRRIGDALELGTTTSEVKSGYGLEPEAELRQLRIIAGAKATAPSDVAATYLAAHALPAPYTDDRRRFVRQAIGAL